jgi:hypothetical protein
MVLETKSPQKEEEYKRKPFPEFNDTLARSSGFNIMGRQIEHDQKTK